MAERQDRAGSAEATGRTIESRTEGIIEVDKTTPWQLLPRGVSLYDWQQDCLPLWLKTGRGTVKVATGGGKTLFALAAAQHLQNEREPDLRLVIVVPTIPLMFQWFDELSQGNLPGSTIGFMGGGKDLQPLKDLRVLICVLNSARERLPGLVAKARWAQKMLLVVDECHRANAFQAQRIFDAKPRYTLGLSATPEHDPETEALPSDEAYEKSAVGKALGPIIYDFTIKQSLEAGLLTPFEVWHIGLSLSQAEASEHARLSREITDLRKSLQLRHRKSRSKQAFLAWCQTQASRAGSAADDAVRFINLANGRKRLLYRAKARIDVTLGVLSEAAADTDGRAIVFHESIEEIEALFLRAAGMGLPTVLEHSRLPDSLRAESIDAFRRGIARVIISAKSLVEGFNVPSADLGIIVASSGSVRQRIQSLGRMLRRKAGDRKARIIVLYVRDTEDEAIYEKADWETIVGADRNRYFHWSASEEGESWAHALTETSQPPRSYRPPSWEIDVADLSPGDPYPAQPSGLDLHVDQSGNLRADDGTLVPASDEMIAAILDTNRYRKARCTPAGHLIVRAASTGVDAPDWRYLGSVQIPDDRDSSIIMMLRIRTSSGRRVIALEEESKKGEVYFALGPDRSTTPEAGRARDRLLEWTRQVEIERGISVKELYWDNNQQYWLEVKGERISHDGALARLEFKR
jgi:superfamily II DNA or RNA helicase